MSVRRRLLVVLLALAAPLSAAHALDTCRCANGTKVRTTRDCASACRGFGASTAATDQERAERRQRAAERQQEREEQPDDADTDRAIRARGQATPSPRRTRSVPAAPANVTSVDPSRPVTNGAGVACLDGKVLIPSQPTSDQIAFCKNR